MFRYRSYQQAFVMTALVILLCLVCLTGATLALFTSAEDDGKIGIVTAAGNVKVDIVDATDITDSLVGDALGFMLPSGDKTGTVLFEPGATFYTQGFRIKNVGNVPVNYSLYISPDDQISTGDFNEAFEVWISTDPKDPSKAVELPFYSRLVVEGSEGEYLSDTFYLFIKMKESAGNEFQGKEFAFLENGTRGIGVTVYAVQGNVDVQQNGVNAGAME